MRFKKKRKDVAVAHKKTVYDVAVGDVGNVIAVRDVGDVMDVMGVLKVMTA